MRSVGSDALSSPRRDYVQPPNNAKREARAKARHASQVHWPIL